MATKPTLAQIARRANVTPATVSRILRNTENFSASQATRDHVIRIANEMGYGPKRAARALVSGKTFTVSVVLGEIERDFTSHSFSVSLTHMIRTLWAQGYATNIIAADRDKAADDAVLQTLRESHSDGYFIPNMMLQPRTLEQLQRSRTPVVSLYQRSPKMGEGYVNHVEMDEGPVMRELVGRLAELGHRQIAWFGVASTAIGRVGAIQDAIARESAPLVLQQLPYHPAGIGLMHDRPQARLAAWQHWDRIRRSTAVICGSDLIAMGLIDAMREKGWVPGQDMTVIGADNIEENPSYQPFDAPAFLTTVDRNAAGRGVAIAQLLLARIEGQAAEGHTQTVPMSLLWRTTHGPMGNRSRQLGPTGQQGGKQNRQAHIQRSSISGKGATHDCLPDSR